MTAPDLSQLQALEIERGVSGINKKNPTSNNQEEGRKRAAEKENLLESHQPKYQLDFWILVI